MILQMGFPSYFLVVSDLIDWARAHGIRVGPGRGSAAGSLVARRGAGLWAGIDVDPARGTGRDLSERLLARRVLVKDTHGSTIRLAPPLMIADADLDWALDQLTDALR